MQQSQTEQIIRLGRVVEITGLSTASVYRLMAAHKFPQRVRLTEHTVGWRVEQVMAWINQRTQLEPPKQPQAAA